LRAEGRGITWNRILIAAFSILLPFSIIIGHRLNTNWLSDLAANGLPLLFIFSVLIFVLALIKRWYVLAFMSILLCVSTSKAFGEVIRVFPVSKKSMDRSVHIMTYNSASFHPNRYAEKVGDKQNSQKIYDWLRQNPTPDVLCIQEFFHGYGDEAELALDSIQSTGNYAYYYLNPTYYKAYNGFFGVVTFSKHRAIKSEPLLFGASFINKGVYHDFVIHGDTLRIMNLHLRSMSLRLHGNQSGNFITKKMSLTKEILVKLREGFKNRYEEINTILRLIEASPYPVVVCGDFNSTPAGYPYQVLKRRMKNSFEEAGFGMGITYHYPPFLARIDQVFHDVSFETLEHTVHWENPYSDHYPLSVKLRLRKAP